MDNIEFAKVLVTAREKQGITQTELAKISGFTRESINHWEHGRQAISVNNADKLLKILNSHLTIGGQKK